MVVVSSPRTAPMSEPAWIVKWRAREALKNGQPEEAQRLLEVLLTAGNRRAFALREDVIRGYLDRAERSLRRDEVEPAWSDLLLVEKLAAADRDVVRLRKTLTRLSLAEIRAALEAGKPVAALQAIAQFKARPAQSQEMIPLEEAAQDWILAMDAAERGEFPLTQSTIDRVRSKLGSRATGLDRFEQDVVRREHHFRIAWGALQEAAAAKNWREMMRRSDEVLAVAPKHREAQQARNRAWQMVQPETVVLRPERASDESDRETSLESTRQRIEEPPVLPKQFFLWIDGVGAWLVCLSPRIAIGQASPEGGPVDVPLYADVSRIHASLTRDEESYILETSRDVLVNGNAVSRAVLQSGDRLSISACPLHFEQPVPGCLTGRLTLCGRRLPMAVDGVLLMADMIVLGPGEKVHVRMPDLPQPLYLFRQKDRLGVRWEGEFSIEGTKHKDRAMLPAQGTVSSEVFTFAIEPIGR